MRSAPLQTVAPPASPLPEVKVPGLDDEPEQVLQGFEGGEEPLGQRRLVGVAHVVVQDFGELPERKRAVRGRGPGSKACWEIRTCRPAWR